MRRVTNTTVHYRCSFDLRPQAALTEPWSSLTKSIRHWIEQSPQHAPPETNNAFFAGWFFRGGEWKPPGSRYHYVKTACLVGDGDEQSPQYWAVRYEHDGDDAARTWRTDIGVTRIGQNTYRFAMTTGHFMRDGYLGREPKPPLPTAPRLVGWLLRSTDWRAFSGTEELLDRPRILNTGDGEAFRRRLEDPGRECPIVLVSRDFASSDFLIDPGLLARKLAGSAAVYETASSELDKELEWCLGRRFSCWNGMVRVYQPGLRFESAGDARKHRFIAGRDLGELGADSVLGMLVQGVARRAEAARADTVAAIEDIGSIERERRMAELKAAAGEKDNKEWVRLLEETNSELEDQNRRKDERIQTLQLEVADLNDTVSRLEFDKRSLKQRVTEAERASASLQARADAIAAIDKLPQNMREVVDAIARLHPDRIAFTDQALRTADGCDFNRVGDAWSCLRAMATTLHDLFFLPGDTSDLEQGFFERCGFRLAMTEGEMTKNDNKLMRLRQDVFEGAAIDITPHVKLDKDTTRAYFCPHCSGDRQLIVIGYIGHLKTAGTRRRRN